jgi:NADPH-dependent curcumin reductase CurA
VAFRGPQSVASSWIDRGATLVATHREIIYARVPDGMPDAGCFRLVEAPLPRPADGQVLARTHFLSIDPYMRRQMGGGHGQYAKPLRPGDVMIGRGAGVVVESRHPNFQSGDRVQSEFGWREHAVLDGRCLRKLPQDLRPLSLSLGIVGQSGATAMVGFVDIADIKAGETVVVSAAAGAVERSLRAWRRLWRRSQHAVGRQYRQAGGAPGRSHRVSPPHSGRGRFGRPAKCKW